MIKNRNIALILFLALFFMSSLSIQSISAQTNTTNTYNNSTNEVDFRLYLRDIQRRIKRSWDPPRGNESKRVVILFKVDKDGRLLSLRLQNSSGNLEADKAAITAVQLATPFRPLPPEFKGHDIDLQFTFDYNVFGVSATIKN